jgi:hypothetical protein
MFHFLFIYLLLLEPIFGNVKYKKFLLMYKLHGNNARIKYYNFILLLLWGLTLYLFLVSIASGLSLKELGLVYTFSSIDYSRSVVIAYFALQRL